MSKLGAYKTYSDERKRQYIESKRDWERRNPDKVQQYRRKAQPKATARIRLSKQTKKIEAIAYKGGVCEDCNGTFLPCVFDLHHLDPSIKDIDISKKLAYKWERLKQELDSCALLCSNCHRVRHNKERNEQPTN